MKSTKVRQYCDKDLPKLANLWNEARRGSHEFTPYTEEKLCRELERAAFILVAVDEQESIIGLALLRWEWYGEELQLLAWPGPQQREIEEQLLATIEQEAKADELTVVVDAEDRSRIEFFTSRGYWPQGSLYQMLIELDRPRSMPPVPQGYLLRSPRPEEEEALIRVVNTAYEGERLRPGALASWGEEDPEFSPEWVQVAEYEGELVAAVVARPDRDFNEHFQARRGYLGPAATLPAHQGKGLAKALTARALDFLQERGLKAASLYTWSGNAAALKVLRSLGFRVGHEWKIFTKPVRVPP